MDVSKELGVQSFCFRGFKDNAKVAGLVKECGINRIELCGVHIDFSDPAGFDAVIDAYGSRDVSICSIGVSRFSNNPAEEEKLFDFVKRAGAGVISADFATDSIPESYRAAEKLADKYDINLAIHNHGGRHWLGSSQMLKQVFSATSERIGLCLDTAWALHSHEDPIKMAEQFGERLYGVHIKDFTFDRSGQHKDVVVGTGNLNLKALVSLIDGLDHDVVTVLEYEADVDNPVPALKQCVDAVRAAS